MQNKKMRFTLKCRKLHLTYELLSKGWLSEAGEIDAWRYRAELLLVFPPVRLLFADTKTAL